MTLTAEESIPTSQEGTIEFQNISKVFDTNPDDPVLVDISLEVPPRAFVSIIGASGCGKSTLLRISGDLFKPTAGQVLVNGVNASEARLSHQIGFVFQAPNLCPWRTVRRNVELPLECMGVKRQERRERALAELARVGLQGCENKYPSELSGGMAQRVAIARALISDPPIMLMDEPFGALDEITRDRLNVELHELWRSTNKAILFVTHSIPEAVLLSTQVVIMGQHPGKIVEVVNIDLPEVRHADIENTPEFFEHVTQVRSGLLEAMGMATQ